LGVICNQIALSSSPKEEVVPADYEKGVEARRKKVETREDVLEQNSLADELLRRLPKGEQVKWLTGKLIGAHAWNDEMADILEGLERVIANDLALREHLRSVYDRLGSTVPFGLKTAIAEKVLEGWYWVWRETDSRNEYLRRKTFPHFCIDAEKCFQFFCKVWDEALGGQNTSFLKALRTILHEHINAQKYEWGHGWNWTAGDFNEWILKDYVPRGIKTILAGARARIGNATLVEREAPLWQAFNIQARSSTAIDLVAAHMATIRQTEELAQRLVERIRSSNKYGDLNPEALVPLEGEVDWRLEGPEVARVIITFRRVADPKLRGNYPKSIADVQEARDQLLAKVPNPPRILIEVEGPDGFAHKEE